MIFDLLGNVCEQAFSFHSIAENARLLPGHALHGKGSQKQKSVGPLVNSQH